MISTQEDWDRVFQMPTPGLQLLKPNIVLIASKNLKIPAGGPCKKGTQVAVMQFYCRDGLQQHFHIHEASFKGNTLKVDVDQRLVHYLPAASPIEPMLRLSMNSWINILHCLYSVIGGRPDVHLLQVGFDSGFNLCALAL